MQRTPALLGVVALAAIVALFLVLRDGDDDEPATTAATATTTQSTTTESTTRETTTKETTNAEPEQPTIAIEGGEPVGGVQELSFTDGEDIRFTVKSDVAEEVHMHGYDVSEEVEAGGSVKFDVPATVTGVFEVELEHSVVPIAEITVNPG